MGRGQLPSPWSSGKVGGEKSGCGWWASMDARTSPRQEPGDALSLAGRFIALFFLPRGVPARPASQCAPAGIERDASGMAGRGSALPQQTGFEPLEQPNRVLGSVDPAHPLAQRPCSCLVSVVSRQLLERRAELLPFD